MTRPPRPLLFDMDGLLLDTERVIQAAFVEECARLGRAGNEVHDLFLGMVGTSGAEVSERVGRFLGMGVDMVAFSAAIEANFNRRTADGVAMRPTVAEVIPALAGAGHDMAVVTSTSGDRACRYLAQAGLLDHFRFVLGGDEVPAAKPDPAPYRMAAERLGCAPGEALAFEDSDTGTRAAVRAGCTTVQIPDLRPAGQPLPALGQHVSVNLAAGLALFDLPG
ncbi:HAD family phosphatase [Salibaculum sp.]|uniref:HAD family hydrolase n=1 Tax=Salibaculum sp. TaxID=2855480 RepID=UPI002B492C41|nr:HAD family phosphatase [Salibaculum sp.]HKL70837.1 HAD family phosphatase [Salibaculum sp.]